MSASRTNRVSIADWFIPAPIAPITPWSRSSTSAGNAVPDRLVEVVVGVVHEDDVEPVEPEPVERVLDAAQHAVAR